MATVRRRPRPENPSTQEAFASDDDVLTDYRQPGDIAPELPEDITALDDVELMQLLTHLTRWTDFASARLADAQVTERRCDMELKEKRAEALIRNWGGGTKADRVTISEAQRDADDSVRAMNQALLDAYAIRKRYEARTQAFERDAAAVSRELTRRLGTEAPRRRESRWSGS